MFATVCDLNHTHDDIFKWRAVIPMSGQKKKKKKPFTRAGLTQRTEGKKFIVQFKAMDHP